VLQPDSHKPWALDETDWGLDRGTWSILKPMFLAADIPVIQLSMDYSPPAASISISASGCPNCASVACSPWAAAT